MKVFKKLSAVVLAALLAMSMSVMAFAADYTITLPNTTGHTYEIYQIFTGDLATKDGNKILSNVKWGANGTGTEGDPVDLAELQALSTFTGTDVQELAKISEFVNLDSTAYETGESKGEVTVPAGYYLIKDEDGSVEGNDAYSLYMVQIVGSVALTAKSSVPTVEKKVKDANDSTGEATDWQDSADHDIGDKVSFQLTGTLPANYADYEHYYYEFHDELSAGLTYNNDAKVYVVNEGTRIEVTNSFDLTGAIASIKCLDLKKIPDVTITSKIVVEYTATLNSGAVLGSAGNPNTVDLEFSNNPNNCGDGTTKPDDTGETPKDTVIVFTYQLDVSKVDNQNTALPGAGFTLSKKDAATGEFKAIGGELTGEQMTQFSWKGLDDGIYELKETTVPVGYNAINPIYFQVEAVHTEGNEPALTDLKITKIATKDAANLDKDEAATEKNGDVYSVADVTLTEGTLTSIGVTCKTDDGTMSTTIVNQPGLTLPSTGGMGTTLFYVAGSVLVAAAAVLLISKKRMEH